MTLPIVEEFIERAQHDRYALIINEEDEAFAYEYLNEILEAYPCTGILVRQTYSGTAFHAVFDHSREVLESIKEKGLLPSVSETCTFGGGVVYAYPTPAQAAANHAAAVYEINYGPGTLRAMYTEDKEDFFQGELCIPPETIWCVQRFL